jgi:Ca2+-binding EF-hand superfamily protein
MYKEFCKRLGSDQGVKSHDQFFALESAFELFEILAGLKFFDLTPTAPKLQSAPSFRAAQGSVDLSSQGLSSDAALQNPQVKRYWSDLFFHVFDTNKDGTVDFCEFVLVLHSIKTEKVQAKAQFLFEVIDKSNNGMVGRDELFELHDLLFRGFRAGFLLTVSEQISSNPKLADLTQEDVNVLMKIVEKRIDKLEIPQLLSDATMNFADLDRDGQLSFDEFYVFVTDTKTRRKCEKHAVEKVGPLLDHLLVEIVDLIKQRFAKLLTGGPASPHPD